MAELEGDDKRQADLVHQAVQDGAYVDLPEGTVLIRWALVADWVTPTGDRKLTKICSDGTTCWEADGLLHAGLDSGWDNNNA